MTQERIEEIRKMINRSNVDHVMLDEMLDEIEDLRRRESYLDSKIRDLGADVKLAP